MTLGGTKVDNNHDNDNNTYYQLMRDIGEIKERLGKVEGNIEWIKKLLGALITAIIGVFISVLVK